MTAVQASQEFDPTERTVINQAQLVGDRIFVTASGTYEPLVGSWMLLLCAPKCMGPHCPSQPLAMFPMQMLRCQGIPEFTACI